MGILGKNLYTPEVCKHLIKKTFKKTALDVYEVMASHVIQLPNKILRIGCLGGGPGSDLTGALTHLIELGHRQFQCVILDYNCQTWRECSEPLAKILVN
jgi:hypothetical protein